MKVTALAGGVGGAKLAYGLSKCLKPEDLSIIVNTGDDFEHFGLYVSPDVDTVCYTLAGLNNPVSGWGRAGETWNFLEEISRLAEPDWFRMGDKDLATHVLRTSLMRQGFSHSQIVSLFCKKWDIKPAVYPMSDNPVRTIVHTVENSDLGFQEYFVKFACQPRVSSFSFDGIDKAVMLPAARMALEQADAVILCPSNPWVSIDPIILLPSIRSILRTKSVIAVSPIIGGKALKGPAAKMFFELGIQPSAVAVAEHYRDFLSGFMLDAFEPPADVELLEGWGIITMQTNIVMHNIDERIRLAEEALQFAAKL
jgi:LPPG:FO 2-phospho-L-lactate transferase